MVITNIILMQNTCTQCQDMTAMFQSLLYSMILFDGKRCYRWTLPRYLTFIILTTARYEEILCQKDKVMCMEHVYEETLAPPVWYCFIFTNYLVNKLKPWFNEDRVFRYQNISNVFHDHRYIISRVSRLPLDRWLCLC